jgi:hypothetical protein
MPSRSSRFVVPASEEISALPSSRAVRVRLAGGQLAQLWIPGGLVSAQAVQRLAGEATRKQAQRAQALRSFGERALAQHERLSRTQQRSLQRGVERMLKADAALAQRVGRFELEWEKESSALQASLHKREAHFRQKSLIQPAIALSALPLFALYGRRNLQHNLTLLVLLLIWLLGDEVTDLLSSQTDADAVGESRSAWWLYAAPIANVWAGWWLLHESQHEPMITGMAAEFERLPEELFARRGVAPVQDSLELVPNTLVSRRPGRRHIETYAATVDLAAYVAPGFELDLRGLAEPPALATLSSVSWSAAALRHGPRMESLAARVEAGKLQLTLEVSASRRAGRGVPLIENVCVAWLVKVLDEPSLARSV